MTRLTLAQLIGEILAAENFKDSKITEAKQVGNLYHYTSAEGLKGILQSNKIKASEEYYLGNDLYFVSFTRNRNFHKKATNFDVNIDYRITLDGSKLSNRYKIKPFAYIPGWNYSDNWEYDWLEDEPESVRRDFFNATGDYDEQEERISFKDSTGSISNIKDYILKVDKVSDLQENYADGKVKGKSRPGRVKRSGASCKGSVTSLRAKAKKYGGEKGKMYHWCANMKAGKK